MGTLSAFRKCPRCIQPHVYMCMHSYTHTHTDIHKYVCVHTWEAYCHTLAVLGALHVTAYFKYLPASAQGSLPHPCSSQAAANLAGLDCRQPPRSARWPKSAFTPLGLGCWRFGHSSHVGFGAPFPGSLFLGSPPRFPEAMSVHPVLWFFEPVR